MNKKIIFLRPNGEVATNAVKQGPPDKKTGEVPFMEILDIGRERVAGGKLLINGKEVYQRIFVQKVYPHIETTKCCDECSKSKWALKGKNKKKFGGICGLVCECHIKKCEEPECIREENHTGFHWSDEHVPKLLL